MAKKLFDVNVICSDPERPIIFGNCSDIKLLSSHLTPIPPCLELHDHEHSHWELSFMISGEMQTFCEGNTILCEEKNYTVLLIPPGTIHRRQFGKSARNCNLTIEFLFSNAESVHNVMQHCVDHGYQFKAHDFLKALLDEMRRLSREDIENPNWLLAHLSQLFLLTFLRDILHITTAHKTKAPVDWKFRENKDRAKDIFRFLNTHVSNKQVLAGLSDFFSLSLRQINRIFESEYHQTLAEAINEIRFKRAVLLLKNSDHKISEIAEETGFSSAAGFYLFFNRHTGCTPQQFRRRKTE